MKPSVKARSPAKTELLPLVATSPARTRSGGQLVTFLPSAKSVKQLAAAVALALVFVCANLWLASGWQGGNSYRWSTRTLLQVATSSSHSRDGCAEALGAPQVALLFLTRGDLFHDGTWRQWFRSAEGLIPADAARESACHDDARGWEAAKSRCSAAAPGAMSTQHLYSVYIHAPPDFKGYAEDSLWAGTLLARRIETGWGMANLAEATRYLIMEAFRDPLNQRFVLLSESDIPLYDPLTLYSQIMWEHRSRINTLPGPNLDPGRWTPRMESPELNQTLWRKSSQWFTLIREHAAVVLDDVAIFSAFQAHCDGKKWDADLNATRWCCPDEHYFPTLLAVRGLENETSGISGNPHGASATYAEWGRAPNRNGASPHSFWNAEITPDFINLARGNFSKECNSTAARGAAQQLFVQKSALLSLPKRADACRALKDHADSHNAYDGMGPLCKLLARKFPETTAETVYSLFAKSGELGLLADPDLGLLKQHDSELSIDDPQISPS